MLLDDDTWDIMMSHRERVRVARDIQLAEFIIGIAWPIRAYRHAEWLEIILSMCEDLMTLIVIGCLRNLARPS